MTVRKAGAVVAAVVATTAVLTGCSASPGVAARVDDRTITQAEVVETQQDLATIINDPPAGTVLVALMYAPVFLDAAAENGVGVSEDQARAVVEQNATQAGLTTVPDFGPGALQVVRFSLAAQNIQQLDDGADVMADVTAQLAALDVDVNPRYGELDPTSGTISQPALPWIVPAQG